MNLANRIGTRLLPFTNPRVVGPPGRPVRHGRPNVVVATPMRSGTHVTIDLLLNNLAAYRTRPLYLDLDQCIKQSDGHDLVAAIAVDAGHVVKTHLPLNLGASVTDDPRVLALIEQAIVVTVRRDEAAVMRSLAQWDRDEEELSRHAAHMREFWTFWSGRATIELAFDDLFDIDAVKNFLDEVARLTSTRRRNTVVMPSAGPRSSIYAAKAFTRLLGRRAPRIDTTIHTMK